MVDGIGRPAGELRRPCQALEDAAVEEGARLGRRRRETRWWGRRCDWASGMTGQHLITEVQTGLSLCRPLWDGGVSDLRVIKGVVS
jgi:hypothetical protein